MTQEMRVWKRERRNLLLVLAAKGSGRLKPSLTFPPVRWIPGVVSEEVQGRGCVGCGLLGILLLLGLFWTGGWNVPPIVSASRKCH